MKTVSVVGICVALGAVVVPSRADAQNAYQCHSMFEQGREQDRSLNIASRAWVRQMERFFESYVASLSEIRKAVDGPQSPRTFDVIRGRMTRLLEVVEDLDESSSVVGEQAAELSETLSDIDAFCDVTGSTRQWLDAKTEAIRRVEHQVEKTQAGFQKLRASLERYREAPAILMRKVDAMKADLDELNRARATGP